jgi:hypothetical protein
MSTLETRDEAAELQALYGRYKAIALSTGAALMLGGELQDLGRRVDSLIVDCRAAQERGGLYSREVATCRDAALDLRPLLEGDTSERALERARASHRALRREVWVVMPCEYVPCCAPGHDHDDE